ncbi:lasso peptide biosynthesis B2 protein [Nocardiopsis sp. NPDC007018]|uniref:lasso peptide biosynthesis B2 protein n=1 Tax=Nocardiopsis sp. NPDC007018 TaxID=3155721 RepID=UPI0033FFE468
MAPATPTGNGGGGTRVTLPPVVLPAPHLRQVCFPSTCVVLDLNSGKVLTLSEQAAHTVAGLLGTVGATDRFVNRPVARDILVALIHAGVLLPGEDRRAWEGVTQGVPSSPSWGTRDSPAALPVLPRAPLRWSALATVALLLVIVTKSGRSKHAFVRVSALVRRHGEGTNDHVVAVRAVQAVRRVGRLLPVRVACWEEAAASYTALRWAGYRSDFRHGVATDPVRLHAWIEVDGRPVAEQADITDYTPFEETHE